MDISRSLTPPLQMFQHDVWICSRSAVQNGKLRPCFQLEVGAKMGQVVAQGRRRGARAMCRYAASAGRKSLGVPAFAQFSAASLETRQRQSCLQRNQRIAGVEADTPTFAYS
jgi:hypothetical protein